MYTTPQSKVTVHKSMYTTCSHGQYKVTSADDKQVKYLNPHNSTLTPLSRVLYLSTSLVSIYEIILQNRRSLLKLYTTHSTYHNHPSQKRSILTEKKNHICLEVEHERKQSCPLTSNNLSSRGNTPSTRSGNKKKYKKERKQKHRHIYIDSRLVPF